MTDHPDPSELDGKSNDAVDEPSENKPRSSVEKRRRPLVPPIWVWVVIAFTVAMIGYVRIREVTDDHAIINILTLLLAFLGSCAFSFWFMFFSGYSGKFRIASVFGVIGAIALFFTFFRIGHVSGELIPSFRLRFGTPPDALLEAPVEAAGSEGVDLATTTEKDFPQFLGPNRNGTITNVWLAKDWSSSPPELLWRKPIGAGWTGFVAVNGYAVTMEQRGEEQLITCYDIESGELMWLHSQMNRHHTILGGTGPRSTPTIQEGKVYTLGPSGSLLCLNGSNGEVVWEDNLLTRYKVPPGTDTKAVAWGRSNSPLIVDDLVVVPAGGPQSGPKTSLVAFDRLTGEVAWEVGKQQVSYASPTLVTIGDQRMIVSVNENNVSGHDPKTGKIMWRVPWFGRSNGEANVSQATLIADGRLLLSKAYGAGSALWKLTANSNGEFTPKQDWENKSALKTKFTNHVVCDDYAYGLSDGILECISIESGKKQWKRGRYGHGQILLVDDVLLIQAESGEVALVDASPAKFKELASFQAIEGKTWNNLCLYGDLLLARNAEEAACYRLPLTK